MAVSKVKTYGLKQARDKLGRFVKTIDTKPYKILLEEADRIQIEAKFETPVESGQLKDSVSVNVVGKLSPQLVASASATSNTGYDYSEIQHDTEWFNHPNGGKANFIRDPFNRGVERIVERLGEEVTYD